MSLICIFFKKERKKEKNILKSKKKITFFCLFVLPIVDYLFILLFKL